MDEFVGTKALFKTLAWYCREGRTFDEAAFKRFKTDKVKDFSNLQKTFVEEYFTSVDVSKLTDHEQKIIENHQKHEIFVDCDVLDELKQHMCGGSDNVEKKTNFNTTFINNIEPLTGNEDDVDEWFNQYDRIAFANSWSREEKGRKLPVWLKDKALNTWYDMPHEKTIDDYSATLKKAFNKAFKSSASEDANKALLGRFRTGIIPEIQSIMCTTEPKNFEEAVELAGKIEKSLELRLSTMTINKIDKDRYNDNKTNAEDPRKSRGANMEEFSNRRNRSKSNYSNRKYNQSRSSTLEVRGVSQCSITQVQTLFLLLSSIYWRDNDEEAVEEILEFQRKLTPDKCKAYIYHLKKNKLIIIKKKSQNLPIETLKFFFEWKFTKIDINSVCFWPNGQKKIIPLQKQFRDNCLSLIKVSIKELNIVSTYGIQLGMDNHDTTLQ
ncbi:hypothetical protein BpHYR1_040034 [Brachionus plicatilis]|uniref:Uncharacterized protein n=1 Tax=Brachionus plicatilis TaxID=10195 RepID=A0A3M7R508_BRAPC|nr:hypothetical protein BpHYR1_040034 [Brachionus plicatilis]